MAKRLTEVPLAIRSEFKRELKALLDKYGASISLECDESSDLYGISGERMEVRLHGVLVIRVSGWELSGSDL